MLGSYAAVYMRMSSSVGWFVCMLLLICAVILTVDAAYRDVFRDEDETDHDAILDKLASDWSGNDQFDDEINLRKTYDGYRVYDVRVFGEQQTARVVREAKRCSAELWNDDRPPGATTLQLQVPPATASDLEQALNRTGAAFQLRIANLQQIIDDQFQENLRQLESNATSKTNYGHPFYREIQRRDDTGAGFRYSDMRPLQHTAYHTFTGIRRHLERLLLQHTGTMQLEVIGRSHERRPIYLARLMTNTSRPSQSRPIIWIDCGIHAREWVSPAICLYIIDRLLGDDSYWLQFYDWHIAPLVNPDGYVYSQRVDRLWRKNRSRNNYCRGVDLNRNFAALWGTFGVTFFECGATFPGYRAFSEPESRAVRNSILRHRQRIVSFNSIHSYGQLWLVPYGYQWLRSPDWRLHKQVAEQATKAMKAVNGVSYRHGVSSLLLYLDSGTSTDWAYSRGIIHSVAIEARDRGYYGFLLPPRLILPTADEVWVGLQTEASILLKISPDNRPPV